MEIINFTPVSALAGGVLIGLAATLLLLANGRIAGISGIAGGIIRPEMGDTGWRICFILGLIGGGALYQCLSSDSSSFFIGVEHIEAVVSKPLLIIGGLLVGIGVTLGSGCTSGHGVCGLAQKSPRSLVATLSFMTSGVITVAVVKGVFGV